MVAYALEYRDVKPGYRVGNDGSVWSCMAGGCKPRLGGVWRRLKPTPQSRGHLLVYLGRKDCRFVHRLVLEAFVGPCPEGQECLHGDGDPGNNQLDNLRWGTPLENYRDSVRHGTAYLGVDPPLGAEHPTSKIDEAMAARIYGIRVATGKGEVAICDELGLSREHRGMVGGIVRGQSWNHVTGLPKYEPRRAGAEGRLEPPLSDNVRRLNQRVLFDEERN